MISIWSVLAVSLLIDIFSFFLFYKLAGVFLQYHYNEIQTTKAYYEKFYKAQLEHLSYTKDNFADSCLQLYREENKRLSIQIQNQEKQFEKLYEKILDTK